MAAERRWAPFGAALVALLIWSTFLSASCLPYEGDGSYEWNEVHSVQVEEDSSKGVCFRKGATTCVKYQIRANKTILAFVALRADAKASLDGSRMVKHVKGSVCSGKTCNVDVGVSEKHSYCLVMLNRNNDAPEFKDASPSKAEIRFKVNGCPSTLWAIISVVIVILLMIALVACCSVCCMHFVRRRNRQRIAHQMNPVIQLGPNTTLPPGPMYQADVRPGVPQAGPGEQYPQVAIGTPQPQSIQFLEAKL
ncbi:unnamed protein product [Ostreobium quekettii]|uniref:Uncharacterized protein n=1 Tax=Ostreobium quekettii TaxID=121088 RepID=A0A8S1INU2_9CHLO|nr:unnamed protein product [Ostreobium quekettii]